MAEKKNTHAFPEGFEDLEHFAPEWVIADMTERQAKRCYSELDYIKRFYDGFYPEIDRVIGYLRTVPMDAMSEQDENLYNLVATWNEMSHPIDLGWKDTDEPGIYPFERVKLWAYAPPE